MELSINDIRELIGSVDNNANPNDGIYEVGKNYFIRTVTHYLTGKLQRVGSQELVLQEAAWIADTGRYADAIKSCDFSEVEPYPPGFLIVGRGSIIDAFQITSLPRQQK